MTLFARLQKLNKEARLPWTIRRDGGEVDILDGDGYSVAHTDAGWRYTSRNVGMAVESVNSLPAVLNLIEAVVSKCVFCSKGQPRISMGRAGAWHQVKVTGDEEWSQLSCPLTDAEAEAVAVFVSGQEEPK